MLQQIPSMLSLLPVASCTLMIGEVSSSLTLEATHSTAPINMATKLVSFSILSLVTALLLLLAIFVFMLIAKVKKRRQMQTESRRFGAVIANSFESVSELDLTHQTWSEFYILNRMLQKMVMPETLTLYLERYVREHVYRDDADHFRKNFKPDELQAISDGELAKSFTFRQQSPKGDAYWCSILLQGMRKSRSDSATVMLYIRNIHDVRREATMANERMAEALRNAERSSRIKSDFMGRISHEIRTPLNAIIGFLAIARQNIDDPTKMERYMQKVDEASRNLLVIVDDLLDISAIEKNNIQLESRPFPLRDLVTSLGSALFDQARHKGVDFTTSMDGPTEEYLIGDAVRLRQVLTHLLSNAIKFSNQGGRVSLIIRQTALIANSAYLSFIVNDTGIGLREGFMERIFTLFEQEEAEVTSRTYGGSGLGLPLVKNIVEMMGGTLDVQSKFGEGSTFTVNLPFSISPPAQIDEQQRRAFASMRVLFVDDHQGSIEYMSLLLQKLGIPFAGAISGDEALQKAATAQQSGNPYQLYIVDWVMPGMSGRETIEQLHAMVGNTAKIVVLTGYDLATIMPEAVGLPIDHFITKPLFQSTLQELFVQLINQQESCTIAPNNDVIELTGKRALLVEDNELNREIALELLEYMGVEADTVSNGQEAFEQYLQSAPERYQWILMDIQMPVMDGYDATRAIRASAQSDASTIPIIAMTANAFPEDISRSLASGMSDHLSKPIDILVMRQALIKHLSKDAPITIGG